MQLEKANSNFESLTDTQIYNLLTDTRIEESSRRLYNVTSCSLGEMIHERSYYYYFHVTSEILYLIIIIITIDTFRKTYRKLILLMIIT